MIFIPLVIFVVIQATAGTAYTEKYHGSRGEERRDSGQAQPRGYY